MGSTHSSLSYGLHLGERSYIAELAVKAANHQSGYYCKILVC